MEYNWLYIIPIIVMAAAISNRDKIWRLLMTFHYRFWSEISGVLSMIACRRHIRDNRIKKYPDRKGMVAIVTGGGRGFGTYIVRELMKCGMHVVVGVRNPKSCPELHALLEKEKLPGTVELMELDVSIMRCVRKFAAEVKAKYPEIHLLVNNAGIIYADFKLTEDHYESHMATNYFGHFLLTHLLLENLKRAGMKSGICSRVVSVASSAHYCCGIIYDDINSKLEYYQRAAYGQSKTAQIMMTRYLDREMVRTRQPVRAYAVHPGVVDTSMVDQYRKNKHLNWFLDRYLKTPLEGATSVVFACIDEGLENRGGLYLSNCTDGWSSLHSQNETNQLRLHDLTCRMLEIKKFGDLSK